MSALGQAIARLRTTQLVYLVHARIPDAPIIVETVEDYIQRGDAHLYYTRPDYASALAKQTSLARERFCWQ